jgi:hypothetical protein
MERNYFVCSVGQPDKNYDTENLNRCILNNCFVLNELNIQKGSISEIKNGDILILKYKEHFFAYGRAISALSTEKDLSDGDCWNWRIDVNIWITGNHIHRYGIKEAQESGNSYETVKKISREFALKKIEEIGFPF